MNNHRIFSKIIIVAMLGSACNGLGMKRRAEAPLDNPCAKRIKIVAHQQLDTPQKSSIPSLQELSIKAVYKHIDWPTYFAAADADNIKDLYYAIIFYASDNFENLPDEIVKKIQAYYFEMHNYDPDFTKILQTLKHNDQDNEYNDNHTICITYLLKRKNGDLVSANNRGHLQIWDTITGICRTTLIKEGISCLLEKDDGDLVSGSYNGTIKIWDTITNKCKITLVGHGKKITSLLEKKNGDLVSGSHDNTIKVWDALTRECKTTMRGLAEGSYFLSERSNGDLLSQTTGIINIWNANINKIDATFGNSKITTKDCLTSNLLKKRNGDLAFGSDDNIIKIWNPEANIFRSLHGHKKSVCSLMEMCNGDLVSGSYDGIIKIWDSATGICKATFQGHRTYITYLHEKQNGDLISGDSTTIKIWDRRTGECKETFTTTEDFSYCLIEGHNGDLIIGSEYNTIKILSRGSFAYYLVKNAIINCKDNLEQLQTIKSQLPTIWQSRLSAKEYAILETEIEKHRSQKSDHE